MEKRVQFKGTITRVVYKSDSFSVYAMTVNTEKFPYLVKSKYGNISISGALPDLTPGVEYEVFAEETIGKYGTTYKVLNVKRDEPTSEEDTFLFLHEILNEKQATVLCEHYPDILQRVKENHLDDVDLNKLKGIKEKTFNKIVNKIVDNFCLTDIVAEFRGYLTLPIIKKLYDRYTSIATLKNALKKDPYNALTSIAGIGFIKADDILLNIEKASKESVDAGNEPIIDFEYDLISSKQRCLACVVYLLQQNESDGNTRKTFVELRRECIDTVPECSDFFDDVVQDDLIYVDDDFNIALRKTYNKEKFIAEQIIKMLSECKNVWDIDTNKFRTVNNFDLSDEQIEVLNLICKNNVVLLNGGAGTGKSFSTNAVIQMFDELKLKYYIFAPTGKAAKVSAEYTKRPASTIHRGLKYNPRGIKYIGDDGKQHLTYWTYNKYNKIDADVILIDEFSMVDVDLFYHLLDAININKTKLLLIGDSSQLPSVGCGNLLHDFIKSKVIPSVTLTKIFRYGEGGLMKIATDTRFCKPYLTKDMIGKLTAFGSNKDYTYIDMKSESMSNGVANLYSKLLEKGYTVEDIQVLSAKNVGECGTIALNNMIQKIANPNCNSDCNIKYGDTIYYEGDIIIQKVNNYKAKNINDPNNPEEMLIANGETGKIKKIFSDKLIIDFDGNDIEYTKDNLAMISLGYAISIHKSQGGQFKVPIIVTPKSHTFMLDSNILYTALTRMKEKCYHIGTISTVNLAVRKKSNLKRNTFMKKLLRNE